MDKGYFLNRLCSEMSTLEGSAFEYMCNPIMRLLVNKDVAHKGCNLERKPVGYSVDYLTPDDCYYVGQCGTDTDYFKQKKPLDDIDKVKKNVQQCKELFLFTNRRATGSDITNLDTAIKAKSLTFKVSIYDSERIADVIYDNIDNPQINEIWSYLSYCYQLVAYLPQRHCIPPLSSRYVSRTEAEEAVKTKLKNSNIVQIYGISGIGKSQIAIKVAQAIAGDGYFSVKWIDGTNFKDGFNSVTIYGTTQTLNLKTYLETTHGLIIIDNLNTGIKQFVESFNTYNKCSSNCIITSLYRQAEANPYELTKMNDEEITLLLNSYDNRPSAELSKLIIKAVQGFPLAVDVMSTYVSDGSYSWEQFSEDMSSIPDLETESSVKIMFGVVML